jgi:hypothetical protein
MTDGMGFRYTVPCSRPAADAQYDEYDNLIAPAVTQLDFEAVYVPPQSSSGTQIEDGVLRESTITKPTLYIESHPDLHSGEEITVNGVTGWQVDGDPSTYLHPWSGWVPPLVVELRRTAG